MAAPTSGRASDNDVTEQEIKTLIEEEEEEFSEMMSERSGRSDDSTELSSDQTLKKTETGKDPSVKNPDCIAQVDVKPPTLKLPTTKKKRRSKSPSFFKRVGEKLFPKSPRNKDKSEPKKPDPIEIPKGQMMLRYRHHDSNELSPCKPELIEQQSRVEVGVAMLRYRDMSPEQRLRLENKDVPLSIADFEKNLADSINNVPDGLLNPSDDDLFGYMCMECNETIDDGAVMHCVTCKHFYVCENCEVDMAVGKKHFEGNHSFLKLNQK